MAHLPVRQSATPAAPSGFCTALAPLAAIFHFCLLALLCLAPASALAQQNVADAEAISAALERKYDAGIYRDLPTAQARYREALLADASGDRTTAVRLLEAASLFDPEYPDAHFTLARVVLLSEPGRAVGELSEGFRILLRSYPWQRHLLANAGTAIVVIWLVALLLAIVGIVVRHLPHLFHVISELLGARESRVGRVGAAALSLSPVLWGLGAIPTATLFAGLLSFRFGRREALILVLFFVSAISFAGLFGMVAPWAGAPRLDEPSLLVDRALTSGNDADLARALEAWEGRDANEPLYPFALGTMARRAGDLDAAERHLTLAAVLRPNTPWILTNLGNVAFAREDVARARQLYESASAADPSAVEPHYNLAQVYTKQLLFAEASREQSRASAVAFDRVRDFSRWGAPQLNRTVMDARPPMETLWDLARRTAHFRGQAALEGNPFLAFATRLGPPSPFALFFLPAIFLIFGGIGQFVIRGLATLHCSNCQKVVCRKCVHRMQQRAFCTECFKSVRDLKSMEFTRLLLTRRDKSAARRRTIGQAALTLVLPGAGQMLRGASLSGFFALLVMTAAALLVIPNGALVPSIDVLPVPGGGWAKRAPLLVLFLITYAISLARYFATTTTRVQGLTGGAGRSASRSTSERREARAGRN